MHPIIRIVLVVAALGGALVVGRVVQSAVAENLVALRSWKRTEGDVRGLGSTVQVMIGTEPDDYRAYAPIDHTWGLTVFHRAPLFVDPADPAHIKPAGFLQLWLAPAQLSILVLILLALAAMALAVGHGESVAAVDAVQNHGRWVFTPSPGPLPDGVSLHFPTKQWKIILGWSVLGLVMLAVMVFARAEGRTARCYYGALGAAFTLALWLYAWHTRSAEISANQQGIRMTSVLGWRHVPWDMVRGVEEKEIFNSYYNGDMRMWEIPFPGSTVRLIAFTGPNGRALMSFGPTLEPKPGLRQLLDLCKQRTGATLTQRKILLYF